MNPCEPVAASQSRRAAAGAAPDRWPVRYADGLSIGLYAARHRAHFERINRASIEQYFHVEPDDARILADPEGEIVAPGGDVIFASVGERIVGTVALRVLPDGGAELTKMGVDEAARGRGVGRRLLDAALLRAREKNLPQLTLWSNTCLATAMALYRRAGFVEAPLDPAHAHYARADIRMVLRLIPP
jgi:GNAT superfamily N-acetyltransferase